MANQELIIRVLKGRATLEEQEAVRRWRESSHEHENQYQELARLWPLLGKTRRIEVQPPPSPLELIARARTEHSPASRGLRTFGRMPSRVAWAAAVVIVLGLAAAVMRYATRPADQPIRAAEFSTGASERVTVQLDDGTIVRLAPESRMRLAARGGDREVWVEGQAFFGVAKREGQPFIVRTRMGDARVLGTRFDVRVREDDLRVVVVDGRVAVQADGGDVELDAGKVSFVTEGQRPSVAQVEDPYELIGWMRQSMIFQHTPLAKAVVEIERIYGTRVILANSVADRTVTVSFNGEPVDEVVMVLCRIADVACRIDPSALVIGVEDRE